MQILSSRYGLGREKVKVKPEEPYTGYESTKYGARLLEKQRVSKVSEALTFAASLLLSYILSNLLPPIITYLCGSGSGFVVAYSLAYY